MKTKAIIFALVIFLLLDAVFIYLNYKVFNHQIIDVQRVVMIAKPIGIIVTYAVILFAFYYFILRTRRPVYEAALLGAIINGVYELTNYSLLKKWKLSTVVLDTLWGATSWGATTYITYQLF
uniref:DUF2177 family protein n=1 Tax=viral metagenome TaxID=1070528 RepID=A0A6C0HZS5_9ZZZZ